MKTYKDLLDYLYGIIGGRIETDYAHLAVHTVTEANLAEKLGELKNTIDFEQSHL